MLLNNRIQHIVLQIFPHFGCQNDFSYPQNPEILLGSADDRGSNLLHSHRLPAHQLKQDGGQI